MAHGNLGNVLLILGELSESAASLRRALGLKPDLHYVHRNLLFCLSHDEQMDAKTLLAEHLGFAKVFEAPVRDAWLAHANTKDPERKLQVGFVSGDYREHAVAYFVEPTLAALAGNPRLTLHAYSNHPVEDQVTRRLQGHFAHWNRVAGM